MLDIVLNISPVLSHLTLPPHTYIKIKNKIMITKTLYNLILDIRKFLILHKVVKYISSFSQLIHCRGLEAHKSNSREPL